MQYEEALQRWGAGRIERDRFTRRSKSRIDPTTVTVTMDFTKGYSCCGGHDPDCYCSMAEEPEASIRIMGKASRGGVIYTTKIEPGEFNFPQILAEIIAAGDGMLTNGE